MRRVFTWLGVALAGWMGVYLVAANVILRTHSLDNWVTGATKGLRLKTDSAWTVWPGSVHVEGVELHFEDYNVQFAVALDSAQVEIALWQLPMKTFHLTRVRAEGVSYRLRHKVTSAAGIERRLARYPKIPGYADPPLFQGPRTPPLTDEQYNLWTIHLEDVDAGVKELWFLEYRFTGKGRAKGGFRLEPERDAATEPCTLTLDGTLRVGADTVATRLHGRIAAQLDRHDPRRVIGAKIFEKISLQTDLHASVADLRWSELYSSAGGVHLQHGKGTLRARTELKHGAWKETTRIRYETDAIAVRQEKVSVTGPLELQAQIAKGGKDAQLALSADSPKLRLAFAGSPRRLEEPSARSMRLTLGTTANLTRPIRMTSLTARGRFEAPELRWLNRPLQSEQLFESGSARATAHLAWSERERTTGKVEVDVKDAGFKLAGRSLQTTGSAVAELIYDPQTERGHARKLEVDLPMLAVATDRGWRPLSGGLTARAEQLTWRGEVPRRVQSRIRLDAGSIETLLPLVISSSIVRAIAKAIVDLGQTRAIVEIDRTPQAIELRLEEGRSGDVTANGILLSEQDEKDVCGRFFISHATLNVGVVLHRGETSVKPFVSPDFWRERPPTTSCSPDIVTSRKPDFFIDPG